MNTVSKSVLVTGGVSGIGRAVVERFAADGFGVVVLDRREPPVPFTGTVRSLVGDVCDPDANAAAVELALTSYGRLDVFIANAGVHDGGVGLRDRPGADLAALARRVLEVDVIGYLLGAKAAAPALEDTRGCMIFTLSDASFVVRGNGAGIAYTVAKHAALGLVRHLAADLAPQIRVNAVAPGGVITELRAVEPGEGSHEVFADPDAIRQQVRGMTPLQVVLSPEQLAASYRFLASDAAAGMTGEVLRPDGGLGVR